MEGTGSCNIIRGSTYNKDVCGVSAAGDDDVSVSGGTVTSCDTDSNPQLD